MRSAFLQTIGLAILALAVNLPATAEVRHQNTNPLNTITHVSEDSWQPEGFVNGTAVPATWLQSDEIILDGSDDEAAWSRTLEVEVPLYFGSVETAWLKALYTDEKVIIRVRWADETENRQHHPWIWDAAEERYVPGPQVEDSVMLSFEAGCEWTPSILGGYIYDFDAWHWLAARSDPLGQALDLYVNVQDRELNDPFKPYQSRVLEDDYIMKFTENHEMDLHADWDELDRVYMLQPVSRDLYVQAVPDGGRQRPDFVETLAAPVTAPEQAGEVYPQFSPVELTGSAGEVEASGKWVDGYWTVEFRRDRITPAEHIFDTIFNRMVQFSVHVFDQVERLDEVSESGRLFLKFLPKEQRLVKK